eukprot:Tamp_25983.p1 GENE.Tamp_25983~~Tamp_25983.p1  ORF type:complete len:108 (-),score=3.33 Tamp_25983:204-527(-)
MQVHSAAASTTYLHAPAWLHGVLRRLKWLPARPAVLQRVSRQVQRLPVLRDTEESRSAGVPVSDVRPGTTWEPFWERALCTRQPHRKGLGKQDCHTSCRCSWWEPGL